VKTTYFEDLRAALLEAYDILADAEEAEMGSDVKGKDIATLSKFRGLFASQLNNELAAAEFSGDSIIIKIGDSEKWGMGRSKDEGSGESPKGPPESVDFLGYYIEGGIGEFAYITKEHFKKRRPYRTPDNLGRFGEGFLISETAYAEEGWERITKVPFSQVRHAISGQRPYDGFERAIAGVSKNMSRYINIALGNTAKSFSAA
jgi:hypothetical protein